MDCIVCLKNSDELKTINDVVIAYPCGHGCCVHCLYFLIKNANVELCCHLCRRIVMGTQSTELIHTDQNKKPHSSVERDGQIYNIAKILTHRVINHSHEYLIKWEGYDNSFNSWEPLSNMTSVSLVENYWIKQYRRKDATIERITEERDALIEERKRLLVEQNYEPKRKNVCRE